MKNILLLEDDLLLGELYKNELKGHDFNVHYAQTAENALILMDENVIDLILLDLMLPHHGGLELVNEIRSQNDWRLIPLIIISSQHPKQFSDISWLKFGVTEYLYKPDLTLKQLSNTVARLVRA